MKPTKLLVSPYERFKDYSPNEFDYEDMLYDLEKETEYDMELFKNIAKELGVECTIKRVAKGKGGMFYIDEYGVKHKEEFEDIFPEIKILHDKKGDNNEN